MLETYHAIKADQTHFTPKQNCLPGQDKQNVVLFMRYVEGQYLGVTEAHPQGNISTIMLWNCYNREDTTNNHVEAWHSSKINEFSSIKNIFKFIVAIQESACQDIVKLNHIKNNNFVPQKTKQQKRRESAMKHVQEQYDLRKINEIEFIKAVMNLI